MNRPTSVTTAAILQLISSIFIILRCVILLLLGGILGLIGTTDGGKQVEGLSVIFVGSLIGFSLITLALGILYFFLIRGLFRLKNWAWIGTIIMNIISLIIDGFMLIGSNISVNFLTVGFAIAILFYLMRPEAREAFSI